METVLKVEHGVPRLLSKCIGVSADAGAHKQVITTQLYWKEVGSDNAGAPARQYRHAHVPPYPTGLNERIPSWCGTGPFIDPEHVPYDIMNDIMNDVIW